MHILSDSERYANWLTWALRAPLAAGKRSGMLVKGMLPAVLTSVMLLMASTLRAGDNRVSVTFLPEFSSVSEMSGESPVFWLGIDMMIADGWHIYWRNPGDSGLPTTIRWEPHLFLEPGEIHWPRPARFDEDGITTYGYSDRVTLLIPVSFDRDKLPDDAPSGDDTDRSGSERETVGRKTENDDSAVTLTADINWLVCKDICIPESARVSLPVNGSGLIGGYSRDGARQIKRSLALVPECVEEWKGHAELDDRYFRIILEPATGKARFPASEEVYFYPDRPGKIEHTAPQKMVREEGRMRLFIPVSRYLRNTPESLGGVLSASDSWVQGKELPAIEMTLPVSKKSRSVGSE